MPDRVQRNDTDQQEVDKATAKLALYHYASCAFSLRVRSAIAALSLDIELCDVLRDRKNLEELVAGGRRSTVPCLRIAADNGKFKWMYESTDIVKYLVERFAPEKLQ